MTDNQIPTKEELIEQIRNILNNLGNGDLSPSAYDTAWVARIPDNEDPSKPMFPQCLKWVIDNQIPDGSWGVSGVEYFHDRIISTLSCIIVLKRWSVSLDKILQGANYINENLSFLTKDDNETIGFEILFPKLFNEAIRLGIELEIDRDTISTYSKKRELKLKQIPPEAIYNKKTTLSYSLEFLDPEQVDWNKIKINRSRNFSYGTSPASTAFAIIYGKDNEAVTYLNELIRKFRNYVPVVYPINIFQLSWALNYIIDLDLIGYFKKEISLLVTILERFWTTHGVTWTQYIEYPDLDDTCVALRAIKILGSKEIDDSIFNLFRRNSKFFGFEGEKEGNPSYIINLIRTLEVYNTPLSRKYLNEASSLLKKYYSLNYCDKWNYSVYYTMSRMLFKDKTLMKNAINFIEETQHENGSWGYRNPGTNIETAFSLMCLFFFDKDTFNSKNDKVIKGTNYLTNSIQDNIMPLWIGKCLYTPKELDYLLINLVLLKSVINSH